MLVARNLDQVQANKRLSRIKVAGGILLFLVGAPISFISTAYLIVAYTLVIFGFVLFNSGLQGVAKWGRKIRNDQLIDAELRRLSDRYTLIHYPRIGNRTLDHVLIHETGIVVMRTKEVIGRVEVQGSRFRKIGAGMLGRFIGMGGPQLGQPGVENGLDRKALLETLAKEAAERDWPTDVPVDGLIVFTAPRIVLSVDGADPPAVKLTELLGWVQSHTRGMAIVLPSDVRQEFAEYVVTVGGAKDEGRIDPRGAVEADATPASRRAARTRPTTPQQVIKARTEKERLARARSPESEATPSSGRGRRRTTAPESAAEDARELSPLVPSSGMAKVKRREKSSR